MGWHRDQTHDELGPVHFEYNVPEQDKTRVAVEPLIDSYPLNVTEKRVSTILENK